MTAGTLAATGLVPAMASAQSTPPTVDYGDVTEGINGQITAALPVALTVVGVVTGILIGIGFMRKLGVAKKPS
ncbi:hypothetical protein PAI11_00570 [Patulibacter medicamentivorans]|uniref:Uncharacterized protein n=1 Tax=Patulibacter medicamentivorans TaxID=1097667 RepID=H0DZV2_9ACTN|nr:hypothetical protein PAI11_00570 [Patulibacter medicamentivorans]